MTEIYYFTASQLLVLASLALTVGFGLGGGIFWFVGWVSGRHDGVNDPGAQFEAGYANGYDDCEAWHAVELTKILEETTPDHLRHGGAL